MRVLIVDDSPGLRARLAEMLTGAQGNTVVSQAGTVAQALAAIPQVRPDVVILDIKLPDGNGIAVLKAVKGAHPAPVVGMLTNYPSDQFRGACLAAGADFFLDKSTQFQEVPTLLLELASRPDP